MVHVDEIDWSKAIADIVDTLRYNNQIQARIADLLEEQNDIVARVWASNRNADIVGSGARDYLYGERSKGR